MQVIGAAEANDRAELARLIDLGEDVNAQASNGTCALHAAVANSAFESAWLLLEHGARMDLQDHAGKTPFHRAAENLKLDFYELFTMHGADPAFPDRDGNSATKLLATARAKNAIAVNNLGLLEELIRQDPSLLNCRTKPHRPAATMPSIDGVAIHVAAIEKNAEAIRLLVGHGADLEVPTIGGADPLSTTALGLAAIRGFTEIVDVLAEAGARVDPQSSFPLHDVACENSSRMVAHLLRLGADPNRLDGRGRTPIQAAVASGRKCRAILKLLLEHGADPNLTGHDGGRTPLGQALVLGLQAEAELLRAHGAREVL